MVRGVGRVMFAAIMLMILGTLNIIYGIGALADASIFVGDTRFILDNLNTLGWVLILLGILQLTGGFSLMAGHTYGEVIGITAASLGAIGALLSIGGAYPWWSLAMFVLCVYVLHGIFVFASDQAELHTDSRTRGERLSSGPGSEPEANQPPPSRTRPV